MSRHSNLLLRITGPLTLTVVLRPIHQPWCTNNYKVSIPTLYTQVGYIIPPLPGNIASGPPPYVPELLLSSTNILHRDTTLVRPLPSALCRELL